MNRKVFLFILSGQAADTAKKSVLRMEGRRASGLQLPLKAPTLSREWRASSLSGEVHGDGLWD